MRLKKKTKRVVSLALALALSAGALPIAASAEEPVIDDSKSAAVESVVEEINSNEVIVAGTPTDKSETETGDAGTSSDEDAIEPAASANEVVTAIDNTNEEESSTPLDLQEPNVDTFLEAVEGKETEEVNQEAAQFNELVDEYNQQEIENLEDTDTQVEDTQETIDHNGDISNEVGTVTTETKEHEENNYSQTDVTIDTGDEQYELSTSTSEQEYATNEDTEKVTFNSMTITEPNSGKTCTITTAIDESGNVSMLLGDEVIPLDITFDETFSGTPEDSVEQYNQAVKAYNQAIDDYIAKAENVNAGVAEYKEFFTEYNKAMEAYNSVINSEVTKPKQDAIRDENEEVLASPNQDSRFDMNESKLESMGGDKVSEDDKTQHKRLKEDVDKAKNDLESDEAKEYDLITEAGIKAYNALVTAYNSAVDNYNSFVEKVNSLLDPNAKPSENVKPLEAQSNPLYVETGSKREVKYYIRKDNGLPDENDNNKYANDLYTDHARAPSSDIIVGTELGGQIHSENVDSQASVEVQNLQKTDDAKSYVIDGKIYCVADNGLLVDEDNVKYQFNGSEGNAYYYQVAADGKVYVAKDDGNDDFTHEGIAVNEGGLRTNTSEENQEIIINKYLAHKLNFESEDAMKQYYANINTLLGVNENDPDYEEKLEAAIRDQICGGDVENPIYQAMYPADGKPAGVDVLWYVIKDSNTGTIDDGIHADGLLYWRDSLEMVDANRLNTLVHLKWVKEPVEPVEEAEINVLDTDMVKLSEKVEETPEPETPDEPTEPEPEPEIPEEPVFPDEPEVPEAPPAPLIPDEDVPEYKTPELIQIPEDLVPTTQEPEVVDNTAPSTSSTIVTIENEEIPLSKVPKTGDVSSIWFALAMLSSFGLGGLHIFKKITD